MDALLLGLFILGVVGILYSTAYAYLEYRIDQRTEYEVLLQQVAETEIFMCYVWPLMYRKLQTWEEQPLDFTSLDRTRSALCVSRMLFTTIRRAMLLTGTEYAEYKRLCKEAMCKRRTWMSPASVERKTEDACATYMWRKIPLDNLWEYLQRVYIA